MRWIVAALMVTGCAAKTWMPIAATSLAITATACDWRQTHDAAMGGWSGTYEGNMLLGSSPTPSKVDSYFATVSIAETIAGVSLAALSPKVRWVGVAAMIAIAGFEFNVARNNANFGPRCY